VLTDYLRVGVANLYVLMASLELKLTIETSCNQMHIS